MNFTKIRELKGFTVYGPWEGRFENGPMITVDGFSIDFYGGNGLFHRGIGQFDVKILVFTADMRPAYAFDEEGNLWAFPLQVEDFSLNI